MTTAVVDSVRILPCILPCVVSQESQYQLSCGPEGLGDSFVNKSDFWAEFYSGIFRVNFSPNFRNSP